MSKRTGFLSRMALRNVKKNWRHSLAAMLSITVGFVAIALFEGYIGDLVQRQMKSYGHRSMYGDVLVQKRGASSPEGRQDPLAYALELRAQQYIDDYLRAHAAQVRTRARFLQLSGLASTSATSTVFLGLGYDVAEGEALRGPWAWNVIAGKPLSEREPDAAVLGRGLAFALDCDVADAPIALDAAGYPRAQPKPLACKRPRVQLTATTEQGHLNAADVQVRGVLSVMLKELDDVVLMLPLAAAQRLLDTRAVSTFSIELAPGVDPAAFAADLTRSAQGQKLELEAMPWPRHKSAELLRQTLDMLNMYRFFIAAVVVTVASMSVAITMTKAVTERTREIGTMRSLGYRRGHIVRLFAWESLWLATLSIALGLVLSVLLALFINRLGIRYDAGMLAEPISLTIRIDPVAYATAAAFLLVVSVAATLRSAFHGARMSIASALSEAGV